MSERTKNLLHRINRYVIAVLIISGILFWTFIIMNFVLIPYENARFMMMQLGIMFWLFQVPFDTMTMLFFICVYILAGLIEHRHRKRLNRIISGQQEGRQQH